MGNWLTDWIADLEGAARGASSEPRQNVAPPFVSAPIDAPKPVGRPRSKAEIKIVWVTTRQPIDSDDPGAAQPGFYSVSDGTVTMHDETGKPTGKEYMLGHGDDPHRIAQRLTREAWLKTRGTTDFDRPLHYAPLGIC
jgi:hypothetical protein